MTARDLGLRMMKLGVLPAGAVIRERRPGVTILVYHRIGGRTDRQLDMPADLFEWQMRRLRDHHAVVSLDEAVAMVGRGAAATGDAVVVTFDDGYDDVYRHAFPILARYGLPATVYLATSYIDEQRPFAFEMGLDPHQRGRPLSWTQVREMARSGLITIGAHTHTHPDIRALGAPEIAQEIGQANAVIADRLGAPARHFAYPWGRVTDAARDLVRRVYRTAAVGGTRKNAYASMDVHALLRVPIQRSDGRLFFRLKLGSYLEGEEWIRVFADRRKQRRHAQAAKMVASQ
jgi:peptidoglycan/xylan/chitin deacetylase (PgdA/CDA1 family)